MFVALNLVQVHQLCLQSAKNIYLSFILITESVYAKIIKPNFFPFLFSRDTLKFVKTYKIPSFSEKFHVPYPPSLSILFLKFYSINYFTSSTPFFIIYYLLILNLSDQYFVKYPFAIFLLLKNFTIIIQLNQNSNNKQLLYQHRKTLQFSKLNLFFKKIFQLYTD